LFFNGATKKNTLYWSAKNYPANDQFLPMSGSKNESGLHCGVKP